MYSRRTGPSQGFFPPSDGYSSSMGGCGDPFPPMGGYGSRNGGQQVVYSTTQTPSAFFSSAPRYRERVVEPRIICCAIL